MSVLLVKTDIRARKTAIAEFIFSPNKRVLTPSRISLLASRGADALADKPPQLNSRAGGTCRWHITPPGSSAPSR